MTRGIPRTGIHLTNVILKMSPCTWPGKSEPTRGRPSHKNEAVEFFKAFPDNHIENDPYMVIFGQGDWTCSVAIFTGTSKDKTSTSIHGRELCVSLESQPINNML